MPPSCSSNHTTLFLYYGFGGLTTLGGFDRVVLQPTHHSAGDLKWLKLQGTLPIAYLSLGEDTGPEAPWHRPGKNEEWGGHYVDVAHPGWRRNVLEQAAAALTLGYRGFFLDTLDAAASHEADAAALIALVADLRGLLADGYLIANRGFTLHERLAPLLDAFLFEAFSTTWQHGYQVLPAGMLLENVNWHDALRQTGLEVFALDYADRSSLAGFARNRAETHGLPVQITNREVNCLPGT